MKNVCIFGLLLSFCMLDFTKVVAQTSPDKIGVIILHPKWSMPAKIYTDFQHYGKEGLFKDKWVRLCGNGPWVCSDDNKIVGHKRNDSSLLTIDLYQTGFLVTSPQCAWSKFKKYSDPVDKSLRICVAPRIKLLKKRGAEKIVVLGKSLGANAAIRAGVIIDGINAIVAMAPGHRPEKDIMQEKHEDDVRHAREKVQSGQGKEKSEYMDINQGVEKQIEVSAESYLSWFDPQGKAVMGLNSPKIKGNVPFLWVAGEDDMISDGTGKEIFDSAPPNPKSKFILVEGGHGEVRDNGRNIIIDWLKAL